MTALTFIPAFVIMMTSFTRIIIVFFYCAKRLALQQSPSNQILIGLALFLSLFIMSPVLNKISDQAYTLHPRKNYRPRSHRTSQKPLHEFMIGQTRQSDLQLFFRISHTQPVQSPDDVPFLLLVPAFITSELKPPSKSVLLFFYSVFSHRHSRSQCVLMAMGMMMLSPLIISCPLKLCCLYWWTAGR